MTAVSAASGGDAPITARRIGWQTAVLTFGFGAAQGLSFIRNALLGHLLSVGDFGIAAALTITLQLTEMVTDLAADRMLVQADDGDDPKLLDTAHAIMLGRGIGLAALLWFTAPLMAGLFGAPQAIAAFQAIALVPLIKGFLHLDWRRAQRRLNNAPSVIMEIVSQAAALLILWPAVLLTGSYAAMLWSAAAQALVLVAVSHQQATAPWRVAPDPALLRRFVAFGWPVLLSAIPLIAVFQGDRILVAQYAGLEAFALYSAAFMLTVVPATLLTRIGQSLYLPLLSRSRQAATAERLQQYTLLLDVTAIGAAAYAGFFILVGDPLVQIAFGAAYGGQGAVIGMVAAMFAVRLVQMPVQALFLAEAASRPLLLAGIIRAIALVPAWYAATHGVPLAVLAACGVAGEVAALGYLAVRSSGLLPGAASILLARAALLTALLLPPLLKPEASVILLLTIPAAALALPHLRAALLHLLPHPASRQPGAATPVSGTGARHRGSNTGAAACAACAAGLGKRRIRRAYARLLERPPVRLDDLPALATDALRQAGAYASDLVRPTVRLGVTGLSRSGKTVFITALVNNLVAGGRLPFFAPVAQGRIRRAWLEPQPDDAVARFAIEDHLASLTAESPRWPEGTRRISQLRVTLEYEPDSLWRHVTGSRLLSIDIIDYPGEWLLDLPLMTMDFRAWSASALAASRSPARQQEAAAWHAFLASLTPEAAEDEIIARDGAALYTAYLQRARDEGQAFTALTPGRFLMPGDLAGSPALTFFPLNVSEGELQKGSLAAMLARRYEAYKTHVVTPFFRDHFSRLDRQIVLVDVLSAVNGGTAALDDLGRSLEAVLGAFRPGANSWLTSILAKRIDRIAFAATKADHLHHTSHDRLEALLNALIGRAITRAQFAGAKVKTLALASVRSTREGERGEGASKLPCVIGVPLAGEQLAGRPLADGKEVALFPGDLPADPAGLLAGTVPANLSFVRFRPPRLDKLPREPFPHIRMDRALDFLLGDRLT